MPDTASIGTVLRVEADGGLDGLEIITVFAPRTRSEPEGRLELIGGGGGPLVTTRLVSKRRRHDHDGPDGRTEGRSRRPDGKRDRRDDRRRDDRRRDDRRRDDRRRDDRRRDRARSGSDGEGDDGDRTRKDRRPRRRDESEKRPRDTSSDARRDRGDRRPARSQSRRGDKRPARQGDTARPPRPRTPGLRAKRVHRQAALEALPEDQRPLAREVLKGGLPGVRKSIERMNAKAATESLPLIKADPVLSLAERLAPVLKAAEWHDRADAALAGISRIDLRDIRSVIAAADRAARTDETRALAESLRTGLAQRLEVDHRKWLDELAATIGEGRTIRALRLSSRPPKAGTPLPPDMAERLAAMAAADLNPTASQKRWSTVVDSVALSPVRTQVIPVGVPDSPAEDLLSAVRRLADQVPQIAALFGIEPEPPSRGPRRPPPPPPKAGRGQETAPPPDTSNSQETAPPQDTSHDQEAAPPPDTGHRQDAAPPQDTSHSQDAAPPPDTSDSQDAAPPQDTSHSQETTPSPDTDAL